VSAVGFREVLISSDLISWVKDREQIIVLDEQHQEMFVLRGVEVAVWGWLALSYPYAKIIRSLTVMLDVSADEAEQCLWATLQKWIDAGILNIESG
jgi:hypothetical protein